MSDHDEIFQPEVESILFLMRNPNFQVLLLHGAKHSPPGRQGAPDWQKGDPPECVPGDPLSHVFICQMIRKFIKWNCNPNSF